MLKKITLILIAFICFFSIGASAYDETQPKEIDPLSNELFDIVCEISEEEFYAVDTIYLLGGELNVNSPYLHLYPGMRDNEKFPYNDGIKRDYYKYTETYNTVNVDGTVTEETSEYNVSGLYDINGNCIYTNPNLEISAMSGSYVYNLGYIVHTTVDWSDDMVVYKIFENTVTNEAYAFFVNECTELLNDGTFYFRIGEKYYKAALKKPAIVTGFLDGNKLYFDQIPVISNGRTLVPVRAIFEALGAEIVWDDATKTVSAAKDGINVSLTIDQNVAYKNGEQINLDVPVTIVGGRTLVPVRFVSDCFGVNVDWDPVMNKVILTR